MKRCKVCKICKEFSDFHKQKSGKFGLRAKCKLCISGESKLYYSEKGEQIKQRVNEHRINNPEKTALRKKKYYENNLDKISEKAKTFYKKNQDRLKYKSKRYYHENKDLIKERSKPYQEQYRNLNRVLINSREKVYRKKNPGVYRAKASKRRAILRGGLVNQDQELLKPFYQKCPVGYHVDHIIPLSKGGLHHIGNLQYLEAALNLQKHNKLDWNDPRPIICLPAREFNV